VPSGSAGRGTDAGRGHFFANELGTPTPKILLPGHAQSGYAVPCPASEGTVIKSIVRVSPRGPGEDLKAAGTLPERASRARQPPRRCGAFWVTRWATCKLREDGRLPEPADGHVADAGVFPGWPQTEAAGRCVLESCRSRRKKKWATKAPCGQEVIHRPAG